MTIIYVTNHTEHALTDGFAGKVYHFEVEKTVEIPEEVARHVFGYGDDNKQPYLARLGWAVTTNDLPRGLERLSNWELSTVPPKKNQVLSPLVERVPLPTERKSGGKVLPFVA